MEPTKKDIFTAPCKPYFLDTKHTPGSNDLNLIFPLNHNTMKYDTSAFTPDKVNHRIQKAELDQFMQKLYDTCYEIHHVEHQVSKRQLGGLVAFVGLLIFILSVFSQSASSDCKYFGKTKECEDPIDFCLYGFITFLLTLVFRAIIVAHTNKKLNDMAEPVRAQIQEFLDEQNYRFEQNGLMFRLPHGLHFVALVLKFKGENDIAYRKKSFKRSFIEGQSDGLVL